MKSNALNKLFNLVNLQIRGDFSYSFKGVKKFTLIIKIGLKIIRFCLCGIIAYILFSLFSSMHMFNIYGYIPIEVMIIFGTFFFIFTLIDNTLRISKSLYESKDIEILLSYPVSSSNVFLSKVIVFYLKEVVRCLTLEASVFISYCLFSNLGIEHYLWVILMSLILPLFTISLSLIISIPSKFIKSVLQKSMLVYSITVALITIAIIILFVNIISLIPSSMNFILQYNEIAQNISEVLDYFYNLAPFNYLTFLIIGVPQTGINQFAIFDPINLISLLIVILTIVVFGGISLFINSKNFISLVASSGNVIKTEVVEVYECKENANAKKTLIGDEFNKIFTKIDSLYEFILPYIICPLVILLINKLFYAMDMNTLGYDLVIFVNMLVILLIIMTANIKFSYCLSKEGKNIDIIKSFPVSPKLVIFSKMLPTFIFSSVSIIVSGIVFKLIFKYDPYNLISVNNMVFFILILLFMNYSHLLLSVSIDLEYPIKAIYDDFGLVDYNKNEIKSTIYAFLMAFIVSLISLLVLSVFKQASNPFLRIFIVVLIFFIGSHLLYSKILNLTFVDKRGKE